MFFIKLLLNLIKPLFFFSILLCLDFIWVLLITGAIIEKNLFVFLWNSFLLFLLLSFTLEYYKTVINRYKDFTKNHFLDTYIFPKELYKILSGRYPHLKKSEVAEVLETMKEFYRFQINEETSISSYIPSRVVDFACQTFFDMPDSSLFFEKLLLKHNKYHRMLPKGTAVLLAGQYEEHINSKISKMWCYCCTQENIDPFFPLSFPSFFTLDKRLKIPLGFIFELDETSFRETLPISEAPSLSILESEINNITGINYLAKRIQYYLGRYDYCHKYKKEELEELFKCIDKNKSLAYAVYGQYSDVALFKKTVLDNSAPPPEDIGCCSGASI